MKNSFKFLLVILCLVLLCFVTGCKEENASDSIGQDTSEEETVGDSIGQDAPEEENVRDSIGQDASFQEVYDAFLAQEGVRYTESDFSLSRLKMRVYSDFFIKDLIQGDSLEDLLAAGTFNEYYITRYHDSTGMLYFNDERWKYDYRLSPQVGYPVYWLEAFLENPLCFFEKSTNSAIPESVTVNSAYFLMEIVYWKCCVFYRTNQGNFVLFIDGFKEDADVYLLPEDIFYDKIQECEILSGDVYGPTYRITADFSDWKLDMQ